jgi:hypothetical protein
VKPKPKGQRPKCLFCGKELRPVFEQHLPGWGVPSSPDYIPGPSLYGDALRAYKETHEWKTFTGRYGGYGDNRFCGLNCGYGYAKRITAPLK